MKLGLTFEEIRQRRREHGTPYEVLAELAGCTRDDIWAMAHDVVIERKRSLPEKSNGKKRTWEEVEEYKKILEQLTQQKKSNSEIAKIIGCSKTTVCRMKQRCNISCSS